MKKIYKLPRFVVKLVVLTLVIALPKRVEGQTYCTPTYTYVDCSKLQRSVYINSVSFGNRIYNSGCSQAGYASVVNVLSNGVQDPITITSGQYYPLKVTAYDYNNSTYQYYSSVNYTVWVDYNRDGTFNNNEERVIYTNTSNGTQYINFGENVAGNMRMRIRTQSTATNDPCAQQDIGETEDYLLKVVPAAPGIVSTYASICYGSSTQLTATGCNYGTVNWTDGNSLQLTGRTVSVSPNQYTTYTATCNQNGVSSLVSTNVYVYVSTVSPALISSNSYNLTVSQPAQTATLIATGCYGTVNWYNSDQPNTAFATGYSGYLYGSSLTTTTTVAPQKDTRYWSTCSSAYYYGCTSARSNEIVIGVSKPNAPTVSSNKPSICPAESAVLLASNCTGTVTWSTNETGNSITVSPKQTTEYKATCNVSGQSSIVSSLTVAVNTPTAITAQPISATVCEGTPVNLAITATGSGSLQYRWSRNGVVLIDSTALASQLTFQNSTSAIAGSYVVSVTGVCGVVQSNTANIIVSPKMTATATSMPTSCFGSNNGAITIATQGGLGNKTYLTSDRGTGVTQTASSFTGLAAGIYPLIVHDEAGCSATTSATVTQPSPITFAVSSTPSNCLGTNEGTITVAAGGGTSPFKYQIGTGSSQSSGTFGNLTGGASYTVTAQDANGCTSSITPTVQQPTPISATVTAVPTLCSGKTGTLSVATSGGTGAKQYKLNSDAYQPTPTWTGLASGSYTITVKDVNNCEASVGAIVSSTSASQFTASATPTNLNCYGDKSGGVKIAASGGTGPLQYKLGNGNYQSGDSFTGVAAGSYIASIQDANGCIASTNVIVSQPTFFTATTIMTQVNCFGDQSGTVTITSSGGTGSTQYQLNGGAFQNENIFRMLGVGTYQIVAKDANGCTAPATIQVTKADSVKASVAVVQASCCSCPNGTLTLAATGGVGTKQAQLGTGAFQELLQFGSLAPGTYKITVKDQNGCTTTLNPVVTSSSNLSLTFGAITNVTCAGGKDGSAAVNIVTGRPPYHYTWSNGDTTAVATKLPEGQISLTLTDADKCVITAKTSLTALNQLPPKPIITLTASGLSVSATSGIQWYSGTSATSGTAIQGATQSTYVPLQTGNYYTIVTANTCASPASDVFNYILTGVLEPVATLDVRPYPNPVSNHLYVEVRNPSYSLVSLKITDLNGTIRHRQDNFPFEGKQMIEMHLPTLAAGLYILQADAGDRKTTVKLIVH